MGFAAVGLIPPIGGALLQEGIDVAVILNALRALTTAVARCRGGMPPGRDIPQSQRRPTRPAGISGSTEAVAAFPHSVPRRPRWRRRPGSPECWHEGQHRRKGRLAPPWRAPPLRRHARSPTRTGIRLSGRDPVSGIEVSLSIPLSQVDSVRVAEARRGAARRRALRRPRARRVGGDLRPRGRRRPASRPRACPHARRADPRAETDARPRRCEMKSLRRHDHRASDREVGHVAEGGGGDPDRAEDLGPAGRRPREPRRRRPVRGRHPVQGERRGRAEEPVRALARAAASRHRLEGRGAHGRRGDVGAGDHDRPQAPAGRGRADDDRQRRQAPAGRRRRRQADRHRHPRRSRPRVRPLRRGDRRRRSATTSSAGRSGSRRRRSR